MNLETRICVYCQNEFEIKSTSRRKHCKNTCKTYASQERNGRREPRNKLASTPPMDDLQQQINEQQKKVDELKSKYDTVVQELIDIHNSLHRNEQMKVKKRLEELNVIEEKSGNDVAEIKALNEQLTVIKQKRGEEKKREKELPLIIQKSYYLYEKELIKLNRWKQQDFNQKTDSLVTSDCIEDVLSFTPQYNFDHFADHKHFDFFGGDCIYFPVQTITPLGHPKQPFSAFFYGECIYSLHNLLMYIAAGLRDCYATKVMFLLDEEMDRNDFLRRLKKKEKWLTTIHSDIAIKTVQSRGDIENTLKLNPCDFLFIGDAQHLRIDKQFLKKLQSEHSTISIFCFAENVVINLKNHADIVYVCNEWDMGFEKRKGVTSRYDYWDFYFED